MSWWSLWIHICLRDYIHEHLQGTNSTFCWILSGLCPSVPSSVILMLMLSLHVLLSVLAFCMSWKKTQREVSLWLSATMWVVGRGWNQLVDQLHQGSSEIGCSLGHSWVYTWFCKASQQPVSSLSLITTFPLGQHYLQLGSGKWNSNTHDNGGPMLVWAMSEPYGGWNWASDLLSIS